MSIIHIEDGIISTAKQLPSPNHNDRPDNTCIRAIVIHNISLPPDEFAQTDANGLHHVKALFTNQLHWDSHPYFKSIKGMQVSAHVFIERDGMMTQFVNLDKRAWHAGHSAYLGQAQCNDFSIGIELEGSDYQPFTPKQYDVLAQLIVAIYDSYPATRRHLTGHSDIAPNRKTDPGKYFDWGRLRQQVAKRLAAQTSDKQPNETKSHRP